MRITKIFPSITLVFGGVKSTYLPSSDNSETPGLLIGIPGNHDRPSNNFIITDTIDNEDYDYDSDFLQDLQPRKGSTIKDKKKYGHSRKNNHNHYSNNLQSSSIASIPAWDRPKLQKTCRELNVPRISLAKCMLKLFEINNKFEIKNGEYKQCKIDLGNQETSTAIAEKTIEFINTSAERDIKIYRDENIKLQAEVIAYKEKLSGRSIDIDRIMKNYVDPIKSGSRSQTSQRDQRITSREATANVMNPAKSKPVSPQICHQLSNQTDLNDLKYTYFGQIKNGRASGFGWRLYDNKKIFVGIFEDGHMQQGTYITGAKYKYFGEFKNDKKHGQGTHYNNKGLLTYTGLYKEHKRNGFGIKVWENGNIYVGDLRNNELTGKGKFLWKTGSYFDGYWNNGLRNPPSMVTHEDIVEILEKNSRKDRGSN